MTCKYCVKFIGPGPTGWCEAHDELQIEHGRCDDLEPTPLKQTQRDRSDIPGVDWGRLTGRARRRKQPWLKNT